MPFPFTNRAEQICCLNIGHRLKNESEFYQYFNIYLLTGVYTIWSASPPPPAAPWWGCTCTPWRLSWMLKCTPTALATEVSKVRTATCRKGEKWNLEKIVRNKKEGEGRPIWMLCSAALDFWRELSDLNPRHFYYQNIPNFSDFYPRKLICW